MEVCNKVKNILVIIGATNHKYYIAETILERFTSEMQIPLPNESQRAKVFTHYLNKQCSNKNVNSIKVDEKILDNISEVAIMPAKKSEGLSQRSIKRALDIAIFEVLDKSFHEPNSSLTLEILEKAVNNKLLENSVQIPNMNYLNETSYDNVPILLNQYHAGMKVKSDVVYSNDENEKDEVAAKSARVQPM